MDGSTDIEKRLSKLESDVKIIKKSQITKKTTKNRLLPWVSAILLVFAAIFFIFSIAGFWLKTNIITMTRNRYLNNFIFNQYPNIEFAV